MFLRRACHVASIVTLLLVCASCALAQPAQQPNQQNNSDTVSRQQYERDIRAITDELRAIRVAAASANSKQTQQEQPWWRGEGAPEWSNWVLAILALGAGWIAYVQFSHQRDAVHLTERADVLIDTLLFSGPGTAVGEEFPIHLGSIQVILKNYGPTRASKFAFTGIQVVIGDQSRDMAVDALSAADVIGGLQPYEFGFGPLSRWFDRALIATITDQTNELTFSFGYRFTDVFDTVTEAKYIARFLPDHQERFEVKYQEHRHKAKKRQKAHS